jgi:hypothetical protein
MATVSRNEDGKSKPVASKELDGVEVPHKAAREDLSYKNAPLSPGIRRLKGDQVTNWIENLSANVSNWTDGKDLKFRLEPNGFFGSVINIPDEIKNNGFVQRASLRGTIKFLSEDEAYARNDELIDAPDSADESVQEMLKALAPGAARNMTTNFKEGVPDDAEQVGKAMTADAIWANAKNPALKVALDKQKAFELDADGTDNISLKLKDSF